MKKNTWWTIGIIIAVIILAYFIINRTHPETPEALAKCIGENAVLYTQIGCSACEKQKDLFGENVQYINEFICNSDWQECQKVEMTHTPTWIINNEKYVGVQSIEKLKEITGC